jgi:hypothetical protein
VRRTGLAGEWDGATEFDELNAMGLEDDVFPRCLWARAALDRVAILEVEEIQSQERRRVVQDKCPAQVDVGSDKDIAAMLSLLARLNFRVGEIGRAPKHPPETAVHPLLDVDMRTCLASRRVVNPLDPEKLRRHLSQVKSEGCPKALSQKAEKYDRGRSNSCGVLSGRV